MKTISLIIMVAILLEALIEYGKTIEKMISSKEYKTAITQGITIILGIGLAFVFNLQLFNNAMSEFYEGLAINHTIDIILTGILFSRGSNYFSDLISRLTKGTKKAENIDWDALENFYIDEFTNNLEEDEKEIEEEPKDE